MSTTTDARTPIHKHRRDVRWKIVAPVVAAGAALVIGPLLLIAGVATDALVFEQVSVIMGILGTAFVLLPLVLLCVLPYVLAAALAIGAGQLYARARAPIRAARRFTERVAARAHRTLPRLARPLIGFNARLARWEYTLLGWQRSALEAGKDKSHE
ncbi:MAG: hypothetical protein AAGU78_12935 [Chloroflexota bacterium]|nr:hypothetical protein [Anaerolineae bacterium]HMM27422.1 hypothetical protein [Aggregatilineaceae bacterium]